MRAFLTFFCIIFMVLTSLNADLNAESAPKLGRTADGRAYRIDSEGNKVVDYIADLESNVDGLERQVQGLEDELQEKMRVIEKLQAGQGCEAAIKERDLGDNKTRYADSDFVRSGVFEQQDSSQAILSLEKDCSHAISNAQVQLRDECEHNDELRRNEILALQEQLAASRNENRMLQAKLEEHASEKALMESSSSLSAQKEKLQKELNTSSRIVVLLDQDIRSIDESITQLRDELRIKQDEYNLLQAQVAASEKRIAALNEDLREAEDTGKDESTQSAETKAASSRASLSPEVLTADERSYKTSRELAESRQRALDTIKGRVNTEFNQVQSTIAARDRMLKEYRTQQKSAVVFSPALAKSSRGEDVEALRVKLEQVRSMREVSEIQGALKEIQRKMNDDIALMQRLKKLQ